MTKKPTYEELKYKVRILEAEAAQRERADERKYRALVESSMDAILMTGPDGRIFFSNQAACDMFQMTEEELVEGGRSAVVDETDPRLPEALQKRAELGRYRAALRYKRKDGTIFEGEGSSVIFEDEEGQKRTSMVLRDVSERKRAEERIRESEEKYRLIFENAPLGIFYFDAGGVVTACNDKFAEIVGTAREKIVGFNMVNRLGDDLMKATLEAALAGSPGVFEGDSLSVTGQKRINIRAIFAPVISKTGIPSGGIGIAEDISEHELLKQELRETVTLLNNVYSSLDEAVFVVDAKSRIIVSCNAAAEKMFGYPSEEMVGRNTEFLHLDRKAYRDFGKRLFRALEADEIFHMEFATRKRDGTVFPTEHTVKEILDDAGQRILLVSVVRDVTAQKKAMQELQDKEKALTAKTASLEELNTALKVLLDQRDQQKRDTEKTFSENIHNLVIPYLQKIRKTGLTDLQGECMDILESNLKEIIKPHLEMMPARLMSLSPSETRVANLIKQGYRIKEIAVSLNISPRTVEFHRDGIRRKLGIKNQKINLRTYLSSLS